jgi:hypothetical protein
VGIDNGIRIARHKVQQVYHFLRHGLITAPDDWLIIAFSDSRAKNLSAWIIGVSVCPNVRQVCP